MSSTYKPLLGGVYLHRAGGGEPIKLNPGDIKLPSRRDRPRITIEDLSGTFEFKCTMVSGTGMP